jgi:phosphatidylserine/phosphatidylglycerophosphate/cardiolipin synthase-like enzyme
MDVMNAKGVKVCVMPAPESASQSSMQSKMIIVEGKAALVGSVNFSSHSTLASRELGVIFADADPIAQM